MFATWRAEWPETFIQKIVLRYLSARLLWITYVTLTFPNGDHGYQIISRKQTDSFGQYRASSIFQANWLFLMRAKKTVRSLSIEIPKINLISGRVEFDVFWYRENMGLKLCYIVSSLLDKRCENSAAFNSLYKNALEFGFFFLVFSSNNFFLYFFRCWLFTTLI